MDEKMVVFEANNDSYRPLSVLGSCCGNFGVVQLARHLPSQKLVAIKRYNVDKANVEDAYLIEHEIILTKQFKHPNIIPYHVAYVCGSEICIISPLMGYGSCKDLLNTHFAEGLPENAIALILRDILEGLDYIHKKGFIHRSIKASHVLISDNGKVCLTGMKYACPIVNHGKWQRQIHSFPSSTAKNLNWLSPEVLEQNLKGYNEKSDMYSVGIVLCELANGSEPFAGFSTTLMLTEKVRGSAPQLLDSSTVPLEESEVHGDMSSVVRNQAKRKFCEGLHQINALCLQKQPKDRPSASQLLTHPFLKVCRKRLFLPELLKPAVPIGEKVAFNPDEIKHWENIQKLSSMELYTCEWDF